MDEQLKAKGQGRGPLTSLQSITRKTGTPWFELGEWKRHQQSI
jgi:hypothetical protein